MREDREHSTHAKNNEHREAKYLEFRALDEKDAKNGAVFERRYTCDQREELKNRMLPLINDPEEPWTRVKDGKRFWYTHEMFVEDLKKDPLFADKSRKVLFQTIQRNGKWIDFVYFKEWHPEQDEYLRKWIRTLDRDRWVEEDGTRWTIAKVAEVLFGDRILRDKSVSMIESRMRQRGRLGV